MSDPAPPWLTAAHRASVPLAAAGGGVLVSAGGGVRVSAGVGVLVSAGVGVRVSAGVGVRVSAGGGVPVSGDPDQCVLRARGEARVTGWAPGFT